MIKSKWTLFCTSLFLGLMLLPGRIEAKQTVSHGNGHIHNQHPPWWHGAGPDKFWRVYLSSGFESNKPVVELKAKETDILFSYWSINNTCVPQLDTITQTTSRTHSVSIGASETGGIDVNLAAFALFAKLKATAHASVTFNQNWTDTFEDITQISSERTIHPCQLVYFYAFKTRHEAEGTIDCGSHKIICACMIHRKEVTQFCNWFTLHGAAVGWDSYGYEWVQRGLVDPCPCTQIEEGTEVVLEPSGPGQIPPVPKPSAGGAE